MTPRTDEPRPDDARTEGAGVAVSAAAEAGAMMPLWPSDPPQLGDFAILGRLDASDDAVVYAGERDGEQVAVALLTSGAETESYARARFFDAVAAAGAIAGIVGSGDEPDIAPWVAVRADNWPQGVKLAGQLVAPVSMRHLQPDGPMRGPVLRPHWSDSAGRPGRWRVWPLPWPGTAVAGARWTFATALAIVLALAALALLIAVRLFHNQPPAPVGPPYPVPTNPAPTWHPPSTPPPTTPPPTHPGGTGKPGNPIV